MNKVIFILILGTVFISCNTKKVQIEKDFIINENWDNNYNNAILIEKLTTTDSSYSSNNKIDRSVIERLKVDSTFVAYYSGLNANEPDKPRLKGKVFFDKNNGWNWRVNGKEKRVLGSLENNSWYKFSELYGSAIYEFVFVDNNGHTSVLTVNLNNY